MSVDDDEILTPQALYAHTYDTVELFRHPGTTHAAFGDICVLSFFVLSEDVSLLIITIESLNEGHLCFSVCTLLFRQSGVQFNPLSADELSQANSHPPLTVLELASEFQSVSKRLCIIETQK